MSKQLLQRFLALESSGGIILFFIAIIAILWANSPLAYIHQRFIEQFLFAINDGLMAIFFLSVGLELKRGYLDGDFSHYSQIILPAMGALGGMLVPAFIYSYFNFHDAITIKGWATPVATDIAFAIAVLSLFGSRVPIGLKLFLLALAIFDDMGAIFIIAFFYSSGFAYTYLLISAGLFIILLLLNYCAIRVLSLYLFVGALLWLFLLHSGVHPTIAGVLLALAIPDNADKRYSPLRYLESRLNPWVVYLIMPLFALANAGFSFADITAKQFSSTVVVGIYLGLFLGKQIGVFAFSWLFVQLGVAKLPAKTSWLSLYGVALLCGIGFTMSLFLGTLSFENQHIYLAEVRLGVIIGSVLSGLVGAMILFIAFMRNEAFARKG